MYNNFLSTNPHPVFDNTDQFIFENPFTIGQHTKAHILFNTPTGFHLLIQHNLQKKHQNQFHTKNNIISTTELINKANDFSQIFRQYITPKNKKSFHQTKSIQQLN